MRDERPQLAGPRDHNAEKLGRLLASDLFVVVSHHPMVCQRTNENLPETVRRVVGMQVGPTSRAAAFVTLEQAASFCDSRNACDHASMWGEITFSVVAPDGTTAHPPRASRTVAKDGVVAYEGAIA